MVWYGMAKMPHSPKMESSSPLEGRRRYNINALPLSEPSFCFRFCFWRTLDQLGKLVLRPLLLASALAGAPSLSICNASHEDDADDDGSLRPVEVAAAL